MKILTKNRSFKPVEVTFPNLQQLADIFKALEASNFKISYEVTYNDYSTVSEQNVGIFENVRYLEGERGIREIKLIASDQSINQYISVDIKTISVFRDGGIHIAAKYTEGEGEKLVNTYQKLVDCISLFKMNQNIITSHPLVSSSISFVLLTWLMQYLATLVTDEREVIYLLSITVVIYILNSFFFFAVVPKIYMDVEFSFIENKNRKVRKWMGKILWSLVGVSVIGAVISFYVNKFLE